MTPTGSVSVHLGHALAGGAALVSTAVVLAVQRRRAGRGHQAAQGSAPGTQVPAVPVTAPQSPTPGVWGAGWLAVAVLGAATVHAAATRSHFHESAVLGGFFLLLSAGQFAYAAVLVRRPSRLLVAAGLAANVSVATLWLYTRVVGVPFGLSDGPERVGVPDLLSTGFELAAVVFAVRLLRDRPLRRAALTPGQRLGAVLAVFLTSAVVATTGVS